MKMFGRLPRLVAGLSIAGAAMLQAVEFHVAPGGNDTAAGTAAQPFQTLERGRDAVRALQAGSGLPTGGVDVVIHGGQYRLSEAFTLTPQDSGQSGCPVRYRAAVGETPVITSAMPITNWQPALAWLYPCDTYQHDLYLGTDQTAVANATLRSPAYQCRLTTASYAPAAVLLPGTTYYWRVDEVDAGTILSAGVVWSFITMPAPIVWNGNVNGTYDPIYCGGTEQTFSMDSGALWHVVSGTARLGYGYAAHWISNRAGLTVDSGATFNLWDHVNDGNGIRFDALNGAGTITETEGQANTLYLGVGNGSGTINGPVSAAGAIAPGTGVGTFHCGATTLTGAYNCEISGASADILAVTGNLTITGAALNVQTLASPTA